MTDLATLVLAVDSTQVKTGTASLDGLTAAGTKAEAATAALGSTTKTASVAAAEMAAKAQVAAHGLGSFSMSANNARIVGLELTHVTRSMAEQIAMGVSPVRALTMELGRLSTAAQYAGGISGLGRAVAGMLAPFAGLAAAAGILAAAFLGVKQAAADDADMQKFIGTLGLTKKEIEKLKDTTVTWGDVTKATFQVMAEKAGTSSKAIAGFFSSAFHSIGEFGKFSVAVILGAFGGMVQGAHDLILNLPAVVGGGIAAAANVGIAALEKMVNLGIVGLNKLSSTINGVLGTHFGQVAEVSLGRVAGNLGGTLKDIGADVSSTFHRIFNQTEATFDQISARAIKLAHDRVFAQAEDLIGDRADKAAKKAKQAKEEVDHLAEALKQLEHLLYLFDNAKVDITQGSLFQSAGPDLDKMFGKLPDYGNQLVETLRQIADQATVTANALADAFGRPGEVLGGLLSNLARFGEAQQQLALDVADGTKTQAQAERALATMRLQTTGALLGELKSLFKEHSAGYKAMEAAEKAFAVIQAISTIKSVAAGAAKMFSQLGVWAFPAVAAMVAVMAGLGFGGGNSTQKAPGIPTDTQGTGTVLGDSTAKSQSIANSLDLMAKNSTKGLDYSGDMVRSLRSINSNIGNLATAIARQFQAGGSFDTSGLGLGTKSKGIQGLFGSKTTTSLYDQGLILNPTSLADAIANGISGSTYQIIQKVKTNSGFLGIGGGTKTSYSTSYGALDPALQQQVGLILGSLRDSVIQAAKALGLNVSAALNTFQVEIGKISFEGLKGDEITQALQAVFSKVADQMAGFAVAGLEKFQQAGEGLFETLNRLAKDYLTIDAALKSIGKTFGSVGTASIAAREKLIDLAGGLDEFVNQVSFFYDHFLTDTQKTAFLKAQVDATFKSLGVAVPSSVAAFAKLVRGADLSTDAGQKLFESLMQIAPAFYEVATAADQLAATAKSNLLDAYKRESAALQQTADKFHKFANDLRAFRDSLFIGTAGGAGGYNAALVQLMKQAGLAAGGNQDALGGGLQSSAQSFLAIAQQNAHSLQDVERARALVARYLDQAIGGAEGQATVAEQQLTQMKSQVGKLIDIDDHVLTVAEAVKALTALMFPGSTRTGGGGGARAGGTSFADLRQAILERMAARLDDIHSATVTGAVAANKTARVLDRSHDGTALRIVTDSDTPIQAQVV